MLSHGSIEKDNPTPAAHASKLNSNCDPWEQQWELLAMEQEDEDAYLQELVGTNCLTEATSLQVVVNTTASPISQLGSKLPNLIELNLSNSVIESLRDLGTQFKLLQVLWVPRCGLTGLDGVGALVCLRELFAAFNDIQDLQPLDACSELEVLDVEGNCITDVDAVCSLTACTKLQSLTLAGNPVASKPGYDQQILTMLSHLKTLEDLSLPSHAQQQLPAHISNDASLTTTPLASAPVPVAEEVAASSVQNEQLEADLPTAEDEVSFVNAAIKHARVGVDSNEFRELEMSMLFAGGLPVDARPSTSALSPALASSWLRWSQQVIACSRSLHSSHSSMHRCSSGEHSSASSSRPASSLGAAAASSSALGRLSSGSTGPPPSGTAAAAAAAAHLYSARIGTAGAPAGPTTSAAGSAPPTAGVGSGLYWQKNRVRAVAKRQPSGCIEEALEAGADDGSSSMLTFGADATSTIGGSLARDLRRRRHAAAASAATGFAPAPASAPVGSTKDGFWPFTHHCLGGPIGSRPEGGRGALHDVSTSLSAPCNTAADLLLELRRWKIEAADKALAPADDEVSNAAGLPWAVPAGMEHLQQVGHKPDVLHLAPADDATDSMTLADLEPSGLRSPVLAVNSRSQLSKQPGLQSQLATMHTGAAPPTSACSQQLTKHANATSKGRTKTMLCKVFQDNLAHDDAAEAGLDHMLQGAESSPKQPPTASSRYPLPPPNHQLLSYNTLHTPSGSASFPKASLHAWPTSSALPFHTASLQNPPPSKIPRPSSAQSEHFTAGSSNGVEFASATSSASRRRPSVRDDPCASSFHHHSVQASILHSIDPESLAIDAEEQRLRPAFSVTSVVGELDLASANPTPTAWCDQNDSSTDDGLDDY